MTAPADYTSAFYPNSQTGPASRRMLLGFDGWLTQQPADIQNDLTTHFRGFRDPAAVAAEKDRLAAIEFVHERTKAPRRQIADNWHTFRGGLAERLAEMPSGATNYEWEAVKDDDAAFVAMARKRVQFEQDRETMMESIRSQAANAALSVDTGLADKRRLQVFAGFDGSEVPGYDPDDLPAIKAAYNETVQRVRINTQRERAVAREVADYLIAESGGEIAKIAADAADPAALGEAVQRILKLPKDRRPLAIEFVRQHLSAGGNEDVGYGLRGKKPKPVESTAGGGMRALGRGAADVWNKLKSASQRMSESTGLVDDASEFRDVQEQLRSLVNGTLDPLTPGGAIDTMVMGSAQSIPAMAMIAAGPVGRALSVTYYQQGSYEKFKADPAMAGVSDAAVSSMALLSGTAQAALDSVQLGILTKMAGGSGLTKALQGIANPTAALGASGAYVAGQVGRFGAGLALETGIEVVQNQYADAAVQQLGAILGTGAPPDWAKVNAAAMAEFPELALTMIPLVAFGTTAGGIRDARSAAALARSPELLRAAGFGPSQALAIASAENPVGALRRLWNERNPMEGAPAGATPADVARQAWTDANEAAQSAVAAAQDARDTPGVAYVQRTDSGWQMVDTEGTNWQVVATESVPQLLVEAGKANTLKEGLAMQQIADWISARSPNTNQQFTGEIVEVRRTQTGGFEIDSLLKLLPFDAATLANLNEQLALLGGGPVGYVNGANWIAQDGTQMLLNNRSPEGVMTQTHEFVESRFRSLINSDIEFGNLAIRAAKIVAPLFPVEKPVFRNKKKIRDQSDADRAFAERVQRVASGQTTETEARETMVELVVADVLGRRKDGSVMPTGSISAGVTEAIAAATNPAERAALGKFRAFLRAVRSYLLGLFSTAAKLKKGRREGVIKEGDDFSVFAEKLLGLDAEREHVAAVTAAVNAGATGSLSRDSGSRMDVSISDLKEREDLFWRVHGPESKNYPFGPDNATSTTIDGEETLPGYSTFGTAEELEDYWSGNNFAGRRISDDDVLVIAFTGEEQDEKGADGEPLAVPDMQEVYRMTFGQMVNGEGSVGSTGATASLGSVNAGATGSLSGVGSGMSNDPGAARQQDSIPPGGSQQSEIDIRTGTSGMQFKHREPVSIIADHGTDSESVTFEDPAGGEAPTNFTSAAAVWFSDSETAETYGRFKIPARLTFKKPYVVDYFGEQYGGTPEVGDYRLKYDEENLSELLGLADEDGGNVDERIAQLKKKGFDGFIVTGIDDRVLSGEQIYEPRAIFGVFSSSQIEKLNENSPAPSSGVNAGATGSLGLDRAGPGGSLHQLSDKFYKGGQFMPPPDSIGTRRAKKELAKWDAFKSPRVIPPVQAGDKFMVVVTPLVGGQWARRYAVVAKFDSETDAMDAWAESVFRMQARLGGVNLRLDPYTGEESTAGATAGATGSLSAVTPAQDAEYMAAVEAGDVEKARAMVNAAAKVAGYNIGPVFRGSKTGGAVTNYKPSGGQLGDGIYFTDSEERAAKFGDTVLPFYIKITGWDGYAPDAKKSPFDDARDFRDGRAIKWGDGASEGTEFLVDSPEQVKSAQPITRDESGNVIPLSKRFDSSRPEITFSLGSVNTLEALAVQLENKIAAGGASVKLEAYADTARTLEGMARAARANESTERVLAVGEIEAERILMQRRLEEQFTEEVWAGPAGGILSAEDMAMVRSQPVMAEVLRPLAKGEKGSLAGRLMSRRKAGTAGGEYDGADGLPFWLFRGDRRPDQLAQELFEAGLLVEPSPDALWSAIHQSLDTAGRNREWLRKAKQQIAEAKARARTESRTWAAAQRAKLATSDARDEKRALITLDALLAKLPAEVRGRVGGFTRLADLTTNDARRKHLLATLEKVDAEMERYLRREFVKEITATLQKGRAKKVAGQKDKGPLGVNAHAWLETAERYMVMGEADLEARELYIEAILSGAEMSGAVIQELNRQWDLGTGEDAARLALEVEKGISELFGGATHRDPVTREYSRGSGELEAAWKAAKERVEVGRMEWERELETRRQRREGRRAGLSIDSGNAGRPADVQARREAMQGMGGVVTRYFRKGFSFSEFIGDGFGRESDTHRFAEDTAMEATLTTSALWQASQNGLRDFLKALWPRSGTAARLRNLEALSTPKAVEGAPDSVPKLSELQAVHLTMLWQDEQSRPWLRKWGYGDGVPEDPQDPAGPDVQAALEAHLSPHAKLVREWLGSRYDEQYDALNDVFRRLHGVNMPRVKNYTPRMVEHGKDAAVSDPLGGGALSARGVFAGFTKRRRINIGAAPVLEDALRAYTQNQRVVTHFIGWAEASNELRAVFSTSASAPFVKGAMGEQGAADLNQWLSDLEAGGVREVEGSAVWQRWLKANTASALFGKLGVLAKQIPAAYGAAVEIGWGDYIRSARRVMNGTAARPLAGSRIMDIRRFQRPAEIGQAASGTGVSPWDSRLRRIGIPTEKIDLAMDWIGGRIGAVDAFFTSRGAAIAYDAHFQDGKAQRMDDAAAHAYAERETERTISRTAQPDQVMNKSKSENYAGTWGRLLHQFQSANRQALFMTVAAFRDGGVKSADAWRKALTHWVLTGLVTQTVGTMMRDMLSDDNDDELWKPEDYVRAILLGPLTGAVHFGPFIEALWSLWGGFERRQAAAPIAAVTDFGKEMVELAIEDEDFDLKDTEKVMKAFGAMMGGRWAALNVAANIGKQAVGTVDNLATTETEATERDAKRQRTAEKEAREVRESKLTDAQRKALREARKANREKRAELDAAKWRAANPED